MGQIFIFNMKPVNAYLETGGQARNHWLHCESDILNYSMKNIHFGICWSLPELSAHSKKE